MKRTLAILAAVATLSLAACGANPTKPESVAAPAPAPASIEAGVVAAPAPAASASDVPTASVMSEDQGILQQLRDVDCKSKSFERKAGRSGSALKIELNDCETLDLN